MSVNETDDLTELRLWLVRLVSGSIALGLLVVLPYLWWLNVTPIDQREGILGVKDSFELRNQAIKSVIASIQNFATVFGGIAILFNVYYGAKRAKALEKNAIAATQNAIAATKNADVAEQGQLTERFTKAIEQLGSDNISIRLGGIYALESIAEYSQKGEWSERYHWTVMEVLSAFVREKPPLKEDLEDKKAEGEQQPQKLRTDIQAALTVIGQRDSTKDPPNQKLDLSNTDIRGAVLTGANLQGAILSKANLQGAYLKDAKLQGADFNEANLQEAYLKDAKLQGADLNDANLQGAKLWGADLQKAKLQRANLKKAVLNGAELQGAILDRANIEFAYLWYVKLQEARLNLTNLTGVILCEADLKGANLDGAWLKGAVLNGTNMEGVFLDVTHLEGANLSEAKNLESRQLETTFGDSTTLLPYDVEAPTRWLQSGE